MITEYQYTNIREVLSRLLRHPLLQELNIEQVVQYTIDFVSIFGMPKLYEDKETELQIENYRALMPCDLVSINQVKDIKTNICLRSMTDTFKPDENRSYTFKTQGKVLYTSFRRGSVIVSYKAIPVDKDGFPLLIDNSVFLKTLEAYIKKEVFTILFDLGKINNQVLQHAEQQYTWLAGQCQNEFTLPSLSEMESIKNMWTTLIPRTTDFYNGFKDSGELELINQH